jgi:hypothetical protein
LTKAVSRSASFQWHPFGRDVAVGALKYGKYTIVSQPHFDNCRGVWIPSVMACWYRQDGLQFHRFFEIDNTFAAEGEALFFGIVVARTWVDEQQE